MFSAQQGATLARREDWGTRVGGEAHVGRGGLEYKDRPQRSGRSRESKLMTQSPQVLTWMRPGEASHPNRQAGVMHAGTDSPEASRSGGEGRRPARSPVTQLEVVSWCLGLQFPGEGRAGGIRRGPSALRPSLPSSPLAFPSSSLHPHSCLP